MRAKAKMPALQPQSIRSLQILTAASNLPTKLLLLITMFSATTTQNLRLQTIKTLTAMLQLTMHFSAKRKSALKRFLLKAQKTVLSTILFPQLLTAFSLPAHMAFLRVTTEILSLTTQIRIPQIRVSSISDSHISQLKIARHAM